MRTVVLLTNAREDEIIGNNVHQWQVIMHSISVLLIIIDGTIITWRLHDIEAVRMESWQCTYLGVASTADAARQPQH